MLFKEIIAVYSENNKKPINAKCTVTDCYSSWYIYFTLGFKGLMKHSQAALYSEPIKFTV
jgi:hypothetical protein